MNELFADNDAPDTDEADGKGPLFHQVVEQAVSYFGTLTKGSTCTPAELRIQVHPMRAGSPYAEGTTTCAGE